MPRARKPTWDGTNVVRPINDAGMQAKATVIVHKCLDGISDELDLGEKVDSRKLNRLSIVLRSMVPFVMKLEPPKEDDTPRGIEDLETALLGLPPEDRSRLARTLAKTRDVPQLAPAPEEHPDYGPTGLELEEES